MAERHYTEVMAEIVKALEQLNPETRLRVVVAIAALHGLLIRREEPER